MKKFSKKDLLTVAVVSSLLAGGIFVCVFLLHILSGKSVDNPGQDLNRPAVIKMDEAAKNIEKEEPVKDPENVIQEKYEAKLFLAAKWGTGKGQVGLDDSAEKGRGGAAFNYGPQSFDVAENGFLYVLDSVNERLIEYDQNGKYVKDFAIASGGTGDVRVSPDQKYLYIFSWRSGGVYKYDLSGKLMEAYRLPTEMLAGTLGVGGLDFDENGNVMLEFKIEKYDKEKRFYQVGETGDEWKENSHPGSLLSGGMYYTDRWINWQARDVKIIARDGSVKKEFTVNATEKNSKIYMYYAGTDALSNIYVRIASNYEDSISNKDVKENLFYKYDVNGNKIATVDILGPLTAGQKDSYFYTNYFKNIRIDDAGNIYFAFFFKEEGLKIYKYSKK